MTVVWAQQKLAEDIKEEIITNKPPHDALSNQEYRVMLKIASGMSMKDIAKDKYLSTSTVSTYRARILEKLNLNTNAKLIHYAIKNNLID